MIELFFEVGPGKPTFKFHIPYSESYFLFIHISYSYFHSYSYINNLRGIGVRRPPLVDARGHWRPEAVRVRIVGPPEEDPGDRRARRDRHRRPCRRRARARQVHADRVHQPPLRVRRADADGAVGGAGG